MNDIPLMKLYLLLYFYVVFFVFVCLFFPFCNTRNQCKVEKYFHQLQIPGLDINDG